MTTASPRGDGPQSRSARGRDPAELAWTAAACLTSLLVGVIALRLWKEDLRVPFAYYGDANFTLMTVKGVLDHGWFLTNPDLGWPAGQQLHDFPLGGDNMSFAVMWLLGRFTHEAAVVVNLFFLSTFALVGASAYLVLRRLSLTRVSSLVLATVFAILPYHVHKSVFHLMLGFYVAIPLVVLLAVRTCEDRVLFSRSDTRRTLLVVLACIIIGSTGTGYYAAFAIALLVCLSPAAAVAHRSWRPLRTAAALSVLIVAVLLVNLAPSLVYRADHGRNTAMPLRGPQETETFAFNFARLVIPPPDHRFPKARHLSQEIQNTTALPAAGEGAAYLGAIGSAGFALLLGIMLVRLVGGRAPPLVQQLGPAAAIAVTAFVIGATGGIATVFAYVVTPTLHGAGRISLIIAFTSLFAVGAVADRAVARLALGRTRGPTIAAACCALLAFAVYDQALLPYTAGDPVRNAAWASDETFVRQLEAALPREAAVFQLPIVKFIEYGRSPGRLRAYETVRPYLHSRTLKWSYGPMRGRDADWQSALASTKPADLLPKLAAVGFDGILVDRLGVADPESLSRTLEELTRAKPLASPDGRLEFFDMRDYQSRFRRQRTPAAIAELRNRVLRASERER